MTDQYHSNAGALDPTFGNNGIVTIDFQIVEEHQIQQIRSVGSGLDLKIYVAGSMLSSNRYFLGRLNSDGSPDDTFGDKGLVHGRFPGGLSTLKSFAFQQDGQIVIHGNSQTLPHTAYFARHNYKGTLDQTFGENGYTAIEFNLSPPSPAGNERASGSDGNTTVSGVQILPDGKILASEHYIFSIGGQSIGLIIRLTPQGLLDLSFNQIGYIMVTHPDYLHSATQIVNLTVQADGKYLVCGAVLDNSSSHAGMFARYISDGLPDTSFGKDANGFVVIEAEDSINGFFIGAMAKQPNSRILGVGTAFTSPNPMGVMTSIEADGTPNIQFNRGKPLFTELDKEALTSWTGCTIQKDGKIVVVGGVGTNRESDIVVARFINEKFDPDFNNGQGWVRMNYGIGTESATDVTLQDDGKILVCAFTASLHQALVLRFLP